LHYRIVKRLGAGAMGVVYAAEDLKLGRTVALKMLPDELAHDAKALARLTREAKAVSKLDHPNIGTLFALETFEERTFIVMAFYDGETLGQRLHRDPPISLEDATRIAVEMARGLGHAHSQGVFHRDVKPGNVILARQPDGTFVTKILDFGLARLEQASLQLTRPGSTTGTPLYMAPEQVRGQVVSAAADIWAWGVVTYQMLAGRAPFEGQSIPMLMMRIIQSEPLALGQLRPDAPKGVLDAVAGALKKPLEERFSSMAEVLAVLEGGTPPPRAAGVQATTPSALEAMTDSDWPVAPQPVSSPPAPDPVRSSPVAPPSSPAVTPVSSPAPASPVATPPSAASQPHMVPPKRPAWALPVIGAVALVGVGIAGFAAYTVNNPAPPACAPWTPGTDAISRALTVSRDLQSTYAAVPLEDCGAFAYGALSDVKALYPGATKATRQVLALPGIVLTADRTENVQKASLRFAKPLEAMNNANTDGQEFYSADKRFVFASLEPTVPGVEFTWTGNTLNWSFYAYKLQPVQNFVNAFKSLDVDEEPELTSATGLPDDGSVTEYVVTTANEKTAVFFNFAGPSLAFDGVGVPPGIKRYLITNLRPGARYDLSFTVDRNWWDITLNTGGRYTVSSSGVLVLEAKAPQ
jgi:serine/threonine-protein kinase